MAKTYTAKEIEHLMLIAQDVISLDTPILSLDEYDQGENRLGDFVADDSPTPEEELIEQNKREVIDNFIKRYLTDKEQTIIRLRYGLDDGQVKTLEEIGQKFGLSRERVRQIEARAIRKLRVRFAQHHIRREDI